MVEIPTALAAILTFITGASCLLDFKAFVQAQTKSEMLIYLVGTCAYAFICGSIVSFML